jgi:hypothetical protein
MRKLLILTLLIVSLTVNGQYKRDSLNSIVSALNSTVNNLVKVNKDLNSINKVQGRQIVTLQQTNNLQISQIADLSSQVATLSQQVSNLTLQLSTCLNPVPPPTGDIPLPGATFTTLWNDNKWYSELRTYPGQPGIVAQGTINFPDYGRLRSANTASIHMILPGGMARDKRDEMQTNYHYLNTQIGDIVAVGVSFYYVDFTCNLQRPMTIVQFRNIDQNVDGCVDDDIEIVHTSLDRPQIGTVNGVIVNILAGTGVKDVGIVYTNLQKNKWYDVVFIIKYAKDNTGYFKIWWGEPGTLNYNTPNYSYTGKTVHSPADFGTADAPCSGTPTNLGDIFNTPQLRFLGSYQWGPSSILTDYFENYVGPLRINIGENSKTAFLRVIPR